MEEFSMRVFLDEKYGKVEKNTKTAKSTKRASNKASKDNSKYITKVVDGVKYMVLK